MMRGRLVIDLFTTLDGVTQAPGGPEEDTGGGFRFGGWQAPFEDPTIGDDIGGGIRRMDALLLGRRTYEIFAAYWPHHTEGPERFIGRHFAEIPKYVATRAGIAAEWVYPVVLGQGKKVFPDGAASARLRLIAPAVSGPTGTVLLRYASDGDVVTGDMT